jgi:hypothetical protein
MARDVVVSQQPSDSALYVDFSLRPRNQAKGALPLRWYYLHILGQPIALRSALRPKVQSSTSGPRAHSLFEMFVANTAQDARRSNGSSSGTFGG